LSYMDILRKQGGEVHDDIYDIKGNLSPRELRDASSKWDEEKFGPNLLARPAPLKDRRARKEGDWKNNPGFMVDSTKVLERIEAMPSATTTEEMMSEEYSLRGEIEATLEALQEGYALEMERRGKQKEQFKQRVFDVDAMEEILRMTSKFENPAMLEEKFPQKEKFIKDWGTDFAKYKDKIDAFLYYGEPVAGTVRRMFLESPNGSFFDKDSSEWMEGEELAYKKYNGKPSKEVWEDLMNFLGLEVMRGGDKDISRGRIEQHVQFDENNLDQIFHLIPEDDLLEKFPVLFDEGSFDDLESALYILIEDVMEMHDDYLDAEEDDENTEENIEKYLTAIEFLMHVFEITKMDDYVNKNVLKELEEIEEPRPFQHHREFKNIIDAHDEQDAEDIQ